MEVTEWYTTKCDLCGEEEFSSRIEICYECGKKVCPDCYIKDSAFMMCKECRTKC